MNKYTVFAGINFYPSEGWKDFKGNFNSIEDAKTFIFNIPVDDAQWAQIVENHEKIVKEFWCDDYPEKPWCEKEC